MFSKIEIENDYIYKGLKLCWIYVVYINHSLYIKFVFQSQLDEQLEAMFGINEYNYLFTTIPFNYFFAFLKRQILAERKFNCINYNIEQIYDKVNETLKFFILNKAGL